MCRPRSETALEEWIGERLSTEQQSRLSAFAVGPLMDEIGDDTERNRNERENAGAA